MTVSVRRDTGEWLAWARAIPTVDERGFLYVWKEVPVRAQRTGQPIRTVAAIFAPGCWSEVRQVPASKMPESER